VHTHAGSTLHNLVTMAFDLLTSGSKNAEVMLYSICAPSSALIDQVVFHLQHTQTHRHSHRWDPTNLLYSHGSDSSHQPPSRRRMDSSVACASFQRPLPTSTHTQRQVRYIYAAAPHSYYAIQQAGTCLPHKKFPYSWEVDGPRLIHNSIGHPSLQPKQHLD